jgi:Tol biopolymer transport system component
MAFAKGTCLGSYEILTPLGAGGMGEVYKARDTRLDRIVALKVLPTGVADDPARRERFRREARAISSLTHPNICALYDIGEASDSGQSDAVPFLVMEYLGGETLAHRLLRGAIPISEALAIAVQLARALDSAHRTGLTHRDLKPANVMLTPAGVKVLDFGLARWRSSGPDAEASSTVATPHPTLTQAGAVVGTLQYMAPEQLEGKVADHRSDIFALGAIVYEMITGHKAFDGNSRAAVMTAILTSTPPSTTGTQQLSPAALDRVVHKCLVKDPERRWQSASDLGDELAWIGEQSRTGAVAAVATGDAAGGRTAPRHWWMTTVAAAVAVLALIAVFAWRPTGVRGESAGTTMRFSVLPPKGVTDADVPIVSPDGEKIAFVASDASGRSSLWVRGFDSLEARAIAEADAFAFPFWSADSQSIGYFAEHRLRRVAASGGAVQVVCDAPFGLGGTWNREGVIVFAPSWGSALHRVSAAGGPSIPLRALDARKGEIGDRFPQFLQDGHHFVYTAFAAGAARTFLDVASLDSPAIVRVSPSADARAWAPPGLLVFRRETNGPYLAQRFDLATLALSGEAVPIASRLAESGPMETDTPLSVSGNGVLAYETVDVEPLIELAWFRRTGQKLGALGAPANYSGISLSRDSARVAVGRTETNGNRDIWVMDAATGAVSRTTANAQAREPVWSSDGERIAFASSRSGPSDLYVSKWNSAGSDDTLLLSDKWKWANSWSDDGRFVLFSEFGNDRVVSLWTLPLESGGKPHVYLHSSFSNSDGHFSPDGRWVAYTSNETGRQEIYVQRFPAPSAKSRISVSGGQRPRWRRDGKEIFYVGDDGRLMATQIKAGATVEASAPKPVFNLPGPASIEFYDVSGDGRRFLIGSTARAGSRSPITIVLNWTTALKK